MRGVLLAAALIGNVAVALAQETDTLRVPADSVRAEAVVAEDAVGLAASDLPPVGFVGPEPGLAVGDTLPARLPALDATALLAGVPGSFVYDLGAAGWPHGWSPRGLDPNRVPLALNGLPFNDLLTGRPLFDLLPLAVIEPLRTGGVRFGRPAAVYARLRPFLGPQPLTELRYLRGGYGLQSIDALHMQRRRQTLFGQPGVLHLLGVYSGRGADGAYPGSQLRSARHIQARIRYEQLDWSVELHEMNTRRRVGAHSGVRPIDPSQFETIYNPLLADVLNPNTRRGILRNDLALTYRRRLLDEPLTATVYWTAERFDYRTLDTLTQAHLDRYGLRLQQDMRGGVHNVRFRVEAYHDRATGNAVASTSGTRAHVTVRDSLEFGAFTTVFEAVAQAYDGSVHPGGVVRVTRAYGGLETTAGLSLAGEPAAVVENAGFGGFVQLPSDGIAAGRVVDADAGAGFSAGPFDLRLTAFMSSTADPRDFFAGSKQDTVEVRVVDGIFNRPGVTVDAAWREDTRRGAYFTLQSTATTLLDANASESRRRIGESLPAVFVRGIIGARVQLFQGDLDLDISLRGRAWSAMRSRTLHPQTGLLVLPAPDSRVLGPSGTLDLYVEAGVRSARIHIAYENILSGTTLMAGTMLVPIYPLPGPTLRFGVHWPIFD